MIGTAITVQFAGETHGVFDSIDQVWGRARELAHVATLRTQDARQAYLKFGLFLAGIREMFPRGSWTQHLHTHGIHLRRAQRAVRMATQYASRVDSEPNANSSRHIVALDSRESTRASMDGVTLGDLLADDDEEGGDELDELDEHDLYQGFGEDGVEGGEGGEGGDEEVPWEAFDGRSGTVVVGEGGMRNGGDGVDGADLATNVLDAPDADRRALAPSDLIDERGPVAPAKVEWKRAEQIPMAALYAACDDARRALAEVMDLPEVEAGLAGEIRVKAGELWALCRRAAEGSWTDPVEGGGA